MSRDSQYMEPTLESFNIYQIRIVLRDISPLVWRRVLVLGDLSALREAANELEVYRQADPSRFHRRPVNQRLIALCEHGDNLP